MPEMADATVAEAPVERKVSPEIVPSTLPGLVASMVERRLTLGICCMENKASSKPMQSILKRLERSGDFEIVIFPQDTILDKNIEEWPRVKCLIAFASKGFPLEKCVRYVSLVKPVLVNHVDAQHILEDRVKVYRKLQEWAIPCPDFMIIDHSTVNPLGNNVLLEHDDEIHYNGRKLCKPFVEKPSDGDRHDIWIYYPRSAGGGAKKLFRKEKDCASAFDADQMTIRRDGIYVYEPFLPTQGTDIKVYTVGPDYVHAEARKALTVDGKVQRSKDGKEIRYPVVLTQLEKAISALIVRAFHQEVCGFDILRTDGRSIVCDVNGWSFVKGNQKYYNDCAVLIRTHLLEACGIFDTLPEGPDPSPSRMWLSPEDEAVRDTFADHDEQATLDPERLRCVLVVMRHGDRRPKEKMKFKTKQPVLLEYFDPRDEDRDEHQSEEVKLKTPEQMLALKAEMEAVSEKLRREILCAAECCSATDGASNTTGQLDVEAKASKGLSELKGELQNIEVLLEVLSMKDRFSGLERKVQLKVSKWKAAKGEPKRAEQKPDESKAAKDGESAESEKKNRRRAAQVQVVAKWGGELTIAGLQQAEDLGNRLRLGLYPNDPTGLLRLHSSFRHDFKIYSSQEGRCQITAASFTKGFLALEGDITPILVSLVTRDTFAQGLLDEPIPKKEREMVKAKVESLLSSEKSLNDPDVLPQSCPTSHSGLKEAARRIGSPLRLMHRLKELVLQYIQNMNDSINELGEEMRLRGDDADEADAGDAWEERAGPLFPCSGMVPRGPGPQVPHDLKDKLRHRWLQLRRKENRWHKLIFGFAQQLDKDKGFDNENVTYDVSKIPDLWDNVYYDMMTHRSELGEVSTQTAETLVDLLHPLNEWVCASEYGISQHEKLRIGTDVTWRLIGKILVDLEFMLDEDVGTLTDEAGKIRASVGAVASTSGGAIDSSAGAARGTLGVGVSPSPCAGASGDTMASFAPPHQTDNDKSGSPDASNCSPPRTKAGQGSFADLQLSGFDHSVSEPCSPLQPEMRSSSDRAKLGSGSTSSISPGDRDAPLRVAESATSASYTPADSPKVSSVVPHEFAPPQRTSSPHSPILGPQHDGDDFSRQCSFYGVQSCLSNQEFGKKSSTKKLTPELRSELKKALRDKSDWHPRLHEQVARIAGIKSTNRVRSRIYVTSASTLHSLFNILRHGNAASGSDESILSDTGHINDLNYLTHIVFRCYEREDAELVQTLPTDGVADAELLAACAKSRYRVEVSISPGVQVMCSEAGTPEPWPTGKQLRPENCGVGPLQVVCHDVELGAVERFLTEVVKEFGGQAGDDAGEDDD